MLDHIPDFPQFCDVSLSLAEDIRPAFESIGPTLSEFSFSNLFLFRKAHAYRVSRLGALLLVAGQGYDGRPYGFPPMGLGAVEEAALRLCDHFASQGAEPVLFPVPRDMLERRFSGSRWEAQGDRDQADYVYLREELATLPGKRFHKRKNRLLKFLREEAAGYSYRSLEDEHLQECLELASGWCQIHCSAERPSTFLETSATIEALRLRTQLGLRGGVILLEGRVRAFCLGEPLNPDTFLVHFEKTQAAKDGLAQLINRDFCLQDLQDYRYVNREQDLGDPGLRQAKEAYRPAFLAEKYRVVPA